MIFDEEAYLNDEFYEQSVIRDKCRKRGISEDKINALLSSRADAFSITDADIARLCSSNSTKNKY